MNAQSLLIELGTEELPPKNLKKLSDAFSAQIINGLVEAQLINEADAQQAQSFATPRRLAVLVPNVLAAQPDQQVERKGPSLQAAIKDGEPTKAALGFAKSCGVEFEQLQRMKTSQGEWLAYSIQEKGRHSEQIIPELIELSLKRLPIAKRMRWGAGSAEFVRPVHWLIVLHGQTVVPCEILSVHSANITRGHRFHGQSNFEVDSADDYEQTLWQQGMVVASFEKRQAMISEQIHALADSVSARVAAGQALLDEVTGLVEYPNAVLGNIDIEFLQVPQQCLVSSMRDHQKYFDLVDKEGCLLPYFITVSNINSKQPEKVKQGNERVLRARLADARFFWETDQKTPLSERVSQLDGVLFHAKLGSVLKKTQRLEVLANSIAEKLQADVAVAQRAALLCKADLVSDMVGEFDELQGVMGHYYANLDGEPELVGQAIEQHYWPKFSGDLLPASTEAQSVALADKLDSLVGIFAAAGAPTGDKDPFALRRAAVSILRILIECEHTLSLSELVAMSAQAYALQAFEIDHQKQEEIVQFMFERFRAYYQQGEEGDKIPTLTIKSVLACRPASPLDIHRRVMAVHQFNNRDEADNLVAANKRISNILKKQQQDVNADVDQSLLVEEAEIALYKAIEQIRNDCYQLFAQGDYASGLNKLASLKQPVDDFFENVMVMSDEVAQQKNRLGLLKSMQQLFLQVADISLLQA